MKSIKKIFLNRFVKLIVKLAITAAALYFVFTKIKFADVFDLLATSNILLLGIALILFAISKLIAAYRLNIFFRKIQVNISSAYNIKLYLLGMFYNLFLPGGIGGDAYKIYLLNKRFEVKTGKIFWAILLDRVVGILALFCLMVLFSYKISYPEMYKYFTWLLIPLGILSFYIFIRKLFNHFTKIIFKTLFYSFFVQLFQLICAAFILMAIGINQDFIPYLFVFLVSSIVAALPITIGGLGAREITFLYGSELMGLNIDISIALSLMFYIITAIVSFIGIYYSFYTKKIK